MLITFRRFFSVTLTVEYFLFVDERDIFSKLAPTRFYITFTEMFKFNYI